jgi:phosphate transport system substrate-binding protein
MRFEARILFVVTAILSAVAPLAFAQQEKGRGTAATPASSSTSLPPNNSAAAAVQASHNALMRLADSFELYHPAKDIKGSMVLSGSTTMLELGKAWADRFRQFHPGVTLTRGADGTNAGLQELAKDSTQIVGVSRLVTEAELQSLRSGSCKEPIALIVALDPLALYVHESNTLAGVTPEQIESVLRAPGQKGKHIGNWSDLGLSGKFANQKIRFHSRSDISGTKAFIKNIILKGEEVVKEAEAHESNGAICDSIAKDPLGAGLAGFGNERPGIRALPLIVNGVSIPANEQSFLAGQYPLVRPLTIVFDKSQMKNDQGLREEMLRYVLSRDGQLEAIREGFFPLDPSFVHKQLDLLCGPRMR